jgi:hypothetical protein
MSNEVIATVLSVPFGLFVFQRRRDDDFRFDRRRFNNRYPSSRRYRDRVPPTSRSLSPRPRRRLSPSPHWRSFSSARRRNNNNNNFDPPPRDGSFRHHHRWTNDDDDDYRRHRHRYGDRDGRFARDDEDDDGRPRGRYFGRSRATNGRSPTPVRIERRSRRFSYGDISAWPPMPAPHGSSDLFDGPRAPQRGSSGYFYFSEVSKDSIS